MTPIAYLDCVGGLAGDMLLGALIDVGAPEQVLHDTVHALGIPDVLDRTERVTRHGIGATHVRVIVPPGQPSRPASSLRELIMDAEELAPRVRERARDALDRLAAAEAQIHDRSPDEVHLHELGGVDTVVDLCGTFALLEAIGVERLVCSPLPFARGAIATDHGRLPAPAPATLALLLGASFEGVAAEGELVTPTGAAIVAVAADAFGELPPMSVTRVGYGAGTRDAADRANLLRVVLGEISVVPATTAVVMLEANVDDLVPELVPDAQQQAMRAGALDVWVTPVQMKKGRPGIILAALARPADEAAVAAALLEHTSTLGVRVAPMRRYELEREMREVDVDGRPVRVKLGLLGGRVVNVAPEHDDCEAVAAGTGRSVKAVWAAALAAASELTAQPPVEPSQEPGS